MKTYAGFTFDKTVEGTLESGEIAGDGSLVLKLYYAREEYTVTYHFTNNPGGKDVPTAQTARYGADVPVSGDMYTDVQGYTFSGWKLNGNVVTTIAGISENVTLVGSFVPKEYEYTVNYYLVGPDGAGKTAKPSDIRPLTSFGTTVSEDAPVIDGYTLDDPNNQKQTLTIGTGNNVINFYYYKTLTLKADEATKVYGDGDPAYSASVTGLLDEDQNDPKFTYTRESGETVGTYEITPSVTGLKSYYKIVNTTPGTLTITQREITVQPNDNQKIYDGTAIEAESSKLAEGSFAYDDRFGTVTFTYSGDRVNVGDQATSSIGSCQIVDKNGADVSANYKIGKLPGKLTITPLAALTISAEGYEEMYDGAAHGGRITTAGAPEAEVTLAYSVDGGDWTETAPQITDVGSQKVTVRASCPNYEDATAEYTLTVYERAITVTGASETVTYNGAVQRADEFEIKPVRAKTGDALLPGHVINISGYEAEGVDAGEYAGTFRYTNDAEAVRITDGNGNDVTKNYAIEEAVGTLTIQPREITIKPADVTAMYDGSIHRASAVEIVDGSIPEGDTLAVSYGGGATNVGETTGSSIANVTITNKDGENVTERNYTVTRQEGNVTITKRSVTLTSDDARKVYDATALTQHSVTVGGDGFVKGEEPSYRFTGTRTNVGTSANSFDFDRESYAQNYTITEATGTLTVEQAELTIVANSSSKPFDGEPLRDGGVSITVGGRTQTVETNGRFTPVDLLGGDRCEIRVEGEQTNLGSSPNTASIRWTEETARNYKIIWTNGYLTVTEDNEIVVTTTGGVFTYDGQPHGATVAVTNVPEGYTVERAESSATALTVLDGAVRATADRLVIRDADGNDVTDQLPITYSDGLITITPTPLYITTQSATKAYDGEPLYAGVTVTGLVNNETVSVTAMGSQTEVGSSLNGYHVAWIGTAKVYNYEIVETLGTLTVTAVGAPPAPQPQNEEDDAPEVRVVDTLLLEDEIVPLAGTTESCCILHFLLALLALVTVLVSGHDTKKLQEKIAELKKKESPDDGEEDGRTDGRKDDN